MRGDVEGLRAVAIGLVLLYHTGLSFVPGGYIGVDVFFVISGFLITTQLVAELARTGGISLPRFYARRAKRLLPAAGVVLAATVVLVHLYLPKVRWQEIGGDIISSALYFVNWRLAARSVDYLAEDSLTSPLQHFWSLAVEEQYYLLWPLLISGAACVSRLTRRRVLPVLWLGLIAVAAPSFAWSIAKTAASSEQAFFVTTTRLWELSIGAAVALGAGLFPRLPRPCAMVMGWGGLAAVAASALLFTSRTPWPGYAAALPTLGTGAVLVAGFPGPGTGAARLLGIAPFRWIGRLSYSLYLWHWPLLVVATSHWGTLSGAGRGAVIAVACALAWLTHHAIENPLRYSARVSSSPRLALTLGMSFTLLGVVAGLTLTMAVSREVTEARTMAGGTASSAAALGAAALGAAPRGDPAGAPVDHVAWMTPEPLSAAADLPESYSRSCQQGAEDARVLSCEYGNPQARITLALVGDSKIVQWLPALERLVVLNDWHMITYTKSACSFTVALTELNKGEPYISCREWYDGVLERLRANPPDYVLTSQVAAMAFDDQRRLSVEAMVIGLRTAWSALTSLGIKVIVVADTPHPGFNVYQCAHEHRDRLSACAYPRERYASSGAPTQHLAARGQRGVRVVELFDAICPAERCAPVIGNVLIYRQGSHLTKTYVETLTPRLAEELSKAGLATEL